MLLNGSINGDKMDTTQTPANEIPEEYWPRCDWCGEPLGECSLEIEKEYRERPTRICPDCEYTVQAIIAEVAPYFIGELLSNLSDETKIEQSYKKPKWLSSDDIVEMARMNMEAAKQ